MAACYCDAIKVTADGEVCRRCVQQEEDNKSKQSQLAEQAKMEGSTLAPLRTSGLL